MTKPISKLVRRQGKVPPVDKKVVEAVAYMLLVQKRPHEDVAEALKIEVRQVTAIREARLQHSDWIDAIAKLGRQGLIT